MNGVVSVIIPCFNRVDYIRETVESVLSQTYAHIDLVVVDDACTDGSREVLESFGDAIRLLEHPGRTNRGQSASINLGIASTDGEFVAILDSDDLWRPNKIEEQVAYLEAHPEVGLVYGNGEAIDDDGRWLYDIYPPEHEEASDPSQVLVDCYFFVPTNSLIRRAALEQAGPFDESLRAAQDHDMAIRLAELAQLAYVDRKWFCYRRHANSISKTRADVRWRNGFTILERAQRRFAYPGHIVRRRRGVLHFRLGQCHFARGEWVQGVSHFGRAFLNDPARALGVITGRESPGSPN